jgi:hypothetical protein
MESLVKNLIRILVHLWTKSSINDVCRTFAGSCAALCRSCNTFFGFEAELYGTAAALSGAMPAGSTMPPRAGENALKKRDGSLKRFRRSP